EAFGFHAGLEAVDGGADLVVGLLAEDLAENVDDFLFVVHDEDAGLAAGHAVERNAVLLHEADELGDGDATVLGTGDAIALEHARVEPLGDRAGGDIADLGHLAGRQYVFVKRKHSRPRVAEGGLTGPESGRDSLARPSGKVSHDRAGANTWTGRT